MVGVGIKPAHPERSSNTPMADADFAREHTTRSVANAAFSRARLFFEDGSHLVFEHSSRQNRWAKASEQGTVADEVCLALSQFRLNAMHLELFFGDGSSAEFHPSPSADRKERI